MKSMIHYSRAIVLCAAYLLTSCAGSSSAPEDNFEGNNAGNEEDAAEAPAEEAAPAQQAKSGEGVNNAIGNEEFGVNQKNLTQSNDAMANSLENPAKTGEGVNNALEVEEGITNAAPQQQQPALTDQPLTDQAIAPIVDQAAAPQTPPAQVPPAPQQPTTGGMVKYVREDGLKVTDQPNGSQVLGTLEQGDHPLVWEDGEWARMSDGRYVPTKGLSEKGVARKRRSSTWK